MKLSNLAIAVAAGSLSVAPAAAQAADVTIERANAPIAQENELAGGVGPAIIVAAIAAAGMLALILTEDDDDDRPISV